MPAPNLQLVLANPITDPMNPYNRPWVFCLLKTSYTGQTGHYEILPLDGVEDASVDHHINFWWGHEYGLQLYKYSYSYPGVAFRFERLLFLSTAHRIPLSYLSKNPMDAHLQFVPVGALTSSLGTDPNTKALYIDPVLSRIEFGLNKQSQPYQMHAAELLAFERAFEQQFAGHNMLRAFDLQRYMAPPAPKSASAPASVRGDGSTKDTDSSTNRSASVTSEEEAGSAHSEISNVNPDPIKEDSASDKPLLTTEKKSVHRRSSSEPLLYSVIKPIFEIDLSATDLAQKNESSEPKNDSQASADVFGTPSEEVEPASATLTTSAMSPASTPEETQPTAPAVVRKITDEKLSYKQAAERGASITPSPARSPIQNVEAAKPVFSNARPTKDQIKSSQIQSMPVTTALPTPSSPIIEATAQSLPQNSSESKNTANKKKDNGAKLVPASTQSGSSSTESQAEGIVKEQVSASTEHKKDEPKNSAKKRNRKRHKNSKKVGGTESNIENDANKKGTELAVPAPIVPRMRPAARADDREIGVWELMQGDFFSRRTLGLVSIIMFLRVLSYYHEFKRREILDQEFKNYPPKNNPLEFWLTVVLVVGAYRIAERIKNCARGTRGLLFSAGAQGNRVLDFKEAVPMQEAVKETPKAEEQRKQKVGLKA